MTEEGRLHFAECQSWLSNPPVVWSGLVWSFAETAKPHQLKPHQWPYQWLAVVSNMCTSTSTTNNQQTLCYKQQIVKPCAHPQPTTNKQTWSYKQQIVNPLCVCMCVCVCVSLSLSQWCVLRRCTFSISDKSHHLHQSSNQTKWRILATFFSLLNWKFQKIK